MNHYKFNFNFYDEINVQTSSYKVYDTKIDFIINKVNQRWWPRVLSQPQKPGWLRIDFDRWVSEDDIKEDESRDVMKDYPRMYDELHKEEYGYRKEQGRKVYLIFYNLFQFIGYLYILVVIGIRYYRDGTNSMSGTYEAIGNCFKFCQLMQYLEVMHPMFGYTKGSVLMPLIQVTGRAFILFVNIDAEERMQTKPVVFYLFIVWAIIEVVRYPFYITTLIDKKIQILTWLRYTIWIPLYPIGVLCEGIVILRNIPYFEENQRFSVDMPNPMNFTWNMTLFMKIYLLILILPGVYFMMNYMSKARIKNLGPKKWQKDK